MKNFLFPCNWIQIIILNWYQRFRTKIWFENPVLSHNFRLRALITNCLLRSWIWFRAMFLILLFKIVFFFSMFACDKSRWVFLSLPKTDKTFTRVHSVDWKKIILFLRVLLKINQNDCKFLRLLLAINLDDFSFSQFLLAINRDEFW